MTVWKWDVGMARSGGVLCAVCGIPVGLPLLASTHPMGACAVYGMRSHQKFMQGIAVMPSGHS